MERVAQMEFDFPLSRGGVRRGAGRPRVALRDRVEHRRRPSLSSRFPVHVTLRLASGLPDLRSRSTHDSLLDALVAGSDRWGLHVVHYSALSNHVHLICEAESAEHLARGMKALSVRIARALNHEWCRSGRVFDDRYHCRVLRTPLEVRIALVYVLQNAHHHGLLRAGQMDPCSSARWFDGWSAAMWIPRSSSPLPRARTWLLASGWKIHGQLDPLAIVREMGSNSRLPPPRRTLPSTVARDSSGSVSADPRFRVKPDCDSRRVPRRPRRTCR